MSLSENPRHGRNNSAESGKTRWSVAFWTAWTISTGLALFNALAWWTTPVADAAAGLWWSDPQGDWSPLLPVLLLAIPFWWMRRPLVSPSFRWWETSRVWGGESCPTPDDPGTSSQHLRAFLLSGLVAIIAWLMSGWVAAQFGDLPPAYHDEFSYLFQAETFLAGRLSFPSHPVMPELFNQMHVLNEGRFASRYFPGTGLWMAPFLAAGDPWLGHRAAHAFAAFLLFWIGRHLANNGVGLLAGLLLALSPGVGLFSNLLLAHHPTLVGLLVFVITFLKLRLALRTGQMLWPWALFAGMGLTYAMLCRPMTAAGVGLPFGIWFGWWLVTGRSAQLPDRTQLGVRVRTAIALTTPLVAGFVGLASFNKAITGDPFVTPYQQYTDIYTPRHVYGFNNRIRGEARLGPKVLENYDTWAENLTPALAARNVWRRLVSSFRWTMGVVPLAMATIVFLLTLDRWSGDWRLIAASILSLHAAHIPYWFEGIMGWHYVFESAAFLVLLFAGVAEHLLRNWRAIVRPWMPLWGMMFLGMVLLTNWVTVVPFWQSRVEKGVGEVSFSRKRYAAFEEYVAGFVGDRPALVLVEPDASDRHIDYVVNRPGLNDNVLFGRFRAGSTDVQKVRETFPDRDVWRIEVATGEVSLLGRAIDRKKASE